MLRLGIYWLETDAIEIDEIALIRHFYEVSRQAFRSITAFRMRIWRDICLREEGFWMRTEEKEKT
jgi:hypothetical protein